ncbi:MurT ligase domain-containing protein [Nonomuraea sp. NPDC050643]|uniref:MurT ligase domain-containing protein n=1 Tax=Nonomuraea sp. NPDC050643 TaxID=3155660 RepID=UPI0033CE16C8
MIAHSRKPGPRPRRSGSLGGASLAGGDAPGLPARLRVWLAVMCGRLVAACHRRTGRAGAGTVAGRIVLRLAPGALRVLTVPLEVVLVSGTNGKTTTTRFVAETLRQAGAVASNETGANMPGGIVTALARAGRAGFGAFEVDERYLPALCAQVAPRAIVLLNLSRDQLDRNPETVLLAQAWRDALRGGHARVVVANCDDPLVCWAASAAARVFWVSTGAGWPHDSWSCPACGGPLERPSARHWSCQSCGLARPAPHWELKERSIVSARTGRTYDLRLRIPGEINYANAAMAVAAGAALGVPPPEAARSLTRVRSVAGRYQVAEVHGRRIRLLLAKNPASWTEVLEILRWSPGALLMLNARALDGHDTSWIWDVDFRRLAGVPVFVTGARRLDLALRLHVADVRHDVVASLREACERAPEGRLDVVANYTAFLDVLREVRRP